MEFNVNQRIPVLAAGFSSGYQQQVFYVQQIRGQGASDLCGDWREYLPNTLSAQVPVVKFSNDRLHWDLLAIC